MSPIERSEWTIYEGDGEHPAQPLVRRGHGKADIEGWKRIEVVPAEQPRRAVDALHEAIQLARDFNRGAMTWQEYDRKLAALEVAHPQEGQPSRSTTRAERKP
jgi:hypothetical protein